MSTEPLTAVERERRVQLNRDSRSALELGLSLDEYRRRHDDEIESWCQFLHAAMDQVHASDPTEVLPHLAAQIAERATAAARKAAQTTAEEVVRRMLRKAIT